MQNQHHQDAPLPPAYGPGQSMSPAPYSSVSVPPIEDGWGKIGVLMVVLALAFAGGVAYFIVSSDEGASHEGAADVGTEGDAGELARELAAAAESQPDAEFVGAATTFDAGSEVAVEVASSQESLAPMAGSAGLLRANGEVDRPAGLISMSIESEPAGAKVIRKSDGVRLGVTPYRYEVESAGGTIVFVLELAGYRSMSIKMPADRDGVRQVMLWPGKGGAPIPSLGARDVKAKAAQSGAGKRPKQQQKKKSASRSEAQQAQAKEAHPKKAQPKKSAGKVDYTAVPIPLD